MVTILIVHPKFVLFCFACLFPSPCVLFPVKSQKRPHSDVSKKDGEKSHKKHKKEKHKHKHKHKHHKKDGKDGKESGQSKKSHSHSSTATHPASAPIP